MICRFIIPEFRRLRFRMISSSLRLAWVIYCIQGEDRDKINKMNTPRTRCFSQLPGWSRLRTYALLRINPSWDPLFWRVGRGEDKDTIRGRMIRNGHGSFSLGSYTLSAWSKSSRNTFNRAQAFPSIITQKPNGSQPNASRQPLQEANTR